MSALGLSRITDCVYDVMWCPGDGVWIAIKVRRDGNVEHLCAFDTEAEADEHACEEREREEAEHGQFGVGS